MLSPLTDPDTLFEELLQDLLPPRDPPDGTGAQGQLMGHGWSSQAMAWPPACIGCRCQLAIDTDACLTL
jgi:hypothetical protein